MTVEGLADELLQLIFTPSLTIPRELLTSSLQTTFGQNDVVSSASILSVCKRWLRVATPLLYESVIIRSTGQSRALAAVFRKNKKFAKYVKNFRLEGAFSLLAASMPLCTNLTTFVLFLDIYSDTNVAPLCKSLPLINPIEVVLHDKDEANARSREAFRTLCKAIPKWTSMTSFECPERMGLVTVKSDMLLGALAQSTSLRTVYCPIIELSTAAWKRLAARPSITFKIRCFLHGRSDDDIRDLVTRNTTLSYSQIECIDISEMPPLPFQPTEHCEKVHPFKKGSVEAATDHMWCIIFRYAIKWHYTDSEDPEIELPPGVHVNTICKNIPLVCKRFERLVRPLILQKPLIMSLEAFKKFSARILETPKLGQQVHTLWLGHANTYGNSSLEHKQLEIELLALLPHLTSLKHFNNRSATTTFGRVISTALFDLLARSAGKTLQTIKGLDFHSKFKEPSFPVFDLFQCLEVLDMHWNIDSPNDFPNQDHKLRSDALDTLHTLTIPGHGWLFKAFCGVSLSGLKSVRFCSRLEEGTLEEFLTESAPNVEHVEFAGAADIAEVFRLAPKLLHMEWSSTAWNDDMEIQTSLTASASHDILEVFTINGFFWRGSSRIAGSSRITRSSRIAGSSENEHDRVVDALFGALDFENFPSLKEVHLADYRWPVAARAMSKDRLPKKAIQVKEAYGVDITDRSGKPWRLRCS